MKVTKSMLESEIKLLRLHNLELAQTIALQATEIESLSRLLEYHPDAKIMMAMFSTNKLARKMIEKIGGIK